MKRIFLTLLLLSLLIVSNAKVCAVVVGVDTYDGTINNLNAAVNDAQKIYNYLRANKSNKVVLLTDKQATKQNILYAMQKTYALAEEEDMILFYFSGHGVRGMFCPTNIKNGTMGLSHREVKNAFKKSKAKNKLCIADTCFAGSIRNTTQPSKKSSSTEENVIIFMSSRESEMSLESYWLNAGVFTNYFIKGMNGAADFNKDRRITLYELYSYVRRNVRRSTLNRQTPIMYGRFNRNSTITTY